MKNPLHNEFLNLIDKGYPGVEIPTEQKRDLKRAFMGGAATMYALLMDIPEDDHEQGVAVASAIITELDTYGREIATARELDPDGT